MRKAFSPSTICSSQELSEQFERLPDFNLKDHLVATVFTHHGERLLSAPKNNSITARIFAERRSPVSKTSDAHQRRGASPDKRND
jgi:hypothetical protein